MAKRKTNWTVGRDPWDAAKKQGRPKRYSSAEEVREHAEGYFLWLEANPLKAAEIVSYQGSARIVDKPKRRVATLRGLCGFLGICQETWQRWRKLEEPTTMSAEDRGELTRVIAQIDEAITEDKFAGATSGLYDSRIISRDLGLIDKQEVSGTVKVSIGQDDADL